MSMEFTGERMVPEAADPATFWHHVYRYRFALPYGRDCDVLDVACGEGYGCASLRAGGARRVLGVDLSADACAHARTRYGVEAVAAPGDATTLPDASLDVVVSFETIEHIPSPEAFVRECARVLRPGGRLVISSPNRELYRKRNGLNPFHCSELSEQEFLDVVGRYFKIEGRFGQYPELHPAGLVDPRLWPYLPWLVMKGANRLRRIAQRLAASSFRQVPPAFGKDPALAVNGKLPAWNGLLNPNIVRRRVDHPRLDFVFLLLVARKPE